MGATEEFIVCVLAIGLTFVFSEFLYFVWKHVFGETVHRKEEIKKEEVGVDGPAMKMQSGCSECGWPFDKPYTRADAGTSVEWVTTEDWDEICPKCGKVNLGYR